MAPSSEGFTGLDPDGVKLIVRRCREAAQELAAARSEIDAALALAGEESDLTYRLRQTETWLAEQEADLLKRLKEIDPDDKWVDYAGQASLLVLGKGGKNVFGFGRETIATGVGRVSLIKGGFRKEARAGAILPYRWVKHDFFETRPLSRPTQFLKGVDEAMKPINRGIEVIEWGSKAWGVFGKEHDRKDLTEAEAVASTAWKVGTEKGGAWLGAKAGAQAGAFVGGQLGMTLVPFTGPAGPVIGAIAGGMVGTMAGSWAGRKLGKFAQGWGEGGLKVATKGVTSFTKGAGKVMKSLNPFG